MVPSWLENYYMGQTYINIKYFDHFCVEFCLKFGSDSRTLSVEYFKSPV